MQEPTPASAQDLTSLSSLTPIQRRFLRRHVSAPSVSASAFIEEQAGFADDPQKTADRTRSH